MWYSTEHVCYRHNLQLCDFAITAFVPTDDSSQSPDIEDDQAETASKPTKDFDRRMDSPFGNLEIVLATCSKAEKCTSRLRTDGSHSSVSEYHLVKLHHLILNSQVMDLPSSNQGDKDISRDSVSRCLFGLRPRHLPFRKCTA